MKNKKLKARIKLTPTPCQIQVQYSGLNSSFIALNPVGFQHFELGKLNFFRVEGRNHRLC